MTSDAAESSFVKQLASNDRRTRDNAVENLSSYLHHRTNLTSLELLKLWKGLFYCMWMSDKPRTQQQLARDLAGLVDTLPNEMVLPFLEAFWTTMAREWLGIDVLRMDKFLYLVRCYVRAGWRQFARRGWRAEDEAQLEAYLQVLGNIPLNPEDGKIPNGMRYHVIDIYIDELDMVDEKREGKMPLELLLKPLRLIRNESPTKSIRLRAQEALNDERLRVWNNGAEAGAQKEPAEEDEEWNGIND